MKFNKLKYSLSGLQMQLLNPDAKIITYDQLNITDLRELFIDTNKIIILYLLKSSHEGHWVALYKDMKHKTINFFDSYGKDLDYFVNLLPNKKAIEYNQKKNRLNYLTKDYLVLYNNIGLQQPNTSTCGCFVSHRLHNSNMNEKEYIDTFFLNKKNPDVIVSDYCFNLLK